MISLLVSLAIASNPCAQTACCLPSCGQSASLVIPSEGITITPVRKAKAKQKTVIYKQKEVVKEVVKEVRVEIPVVVYRDRIHEYGWLSLAPRAAVGVGFGCVDTSKLLGLRINSDKIRLGAEVYTMFEGGHGASLLLYPHLKDGTRAHINFGVAKTGRQLMSSPDIQRRMDYVAGFGIEQRLFRWLYATGDYRASFPSLSGYRTSPYLNPDGTVDTGRKYVDVSNTIGNSLISGQFMIGLLVRIDVL